jgi:plastocyanin
MSLRRRAASAAVALTALFSVAACTEADNGNNTLAGVSQAPATPGASDASAPGGAPSSAPGAPQTTAPARAGEDIELEAKDNEFVPLEISAKAGTFTIVMKNTGLAPHTFTQKDLNVDVAAQAGETAKIKIENAKPGKYHFVCIYHLSVKMEGDLTVT